MDISGLLNDWFHSGKTEVEPSLLAYVLLYTTQNETGLIDSLNYFANYWKNGDLICRTKCIELLAQVVVPSQSSLDSATSNALAQFISDRLEDLTIVPRCIDVILTIVNSKSISSIDVNQLCNAIFTHVKVKKLPQQSRYKVLLILGEAIEKYSSEVQGSKINFIGGFIECMDGEKDPRNLLVAFGLVRAIIDKFDISQHVEDLFDVVFCYFPISFAASSSSNDPLGITTKDLKDSLRRCLACTPYFAYYATPLLIEKLMSTVGSAKKDVMETISMCTPAYGAHAILPYATDLFDALIKEVYQGADSSMVDIALETIHNVVATLGTGISIANIRDPVEKAIDFLLNQCVDAFKEPELKNARSAAHILRAAASASDPACTSVARAAVPVIYLQYNSSDPSIRKNAILDILTELLIASKKLYGSIEDVGYDRDFQTPLLMYKQQILEVFVLSLTESDPNDIALRKASLKGVHELALMKQFLKIEEVNLIVTHLTQQLICSDKQLGHLSLSTLGVIAKPYPKAIGQLTLPALFRELADAKENTTISTTYRNAIDAIKVLGANPAVFRIAISPLLERLDYACSTIKQENIQYVHDLASAVLHIYKEASKKDSGIVQIGQKILLSSVLVKCIDSALGAPGSWYLDATLIETFAMITAITTRLSIPSEQQLSVNDAFKLFVQGDLSSISQSHNQYNSNSLRIFEPRQDKMSIDITLLFTAIVGNCCKDVKLPITSLSTFLQESIQTAMQTTSEARRIALSKTAASIINKWTTEEVLSCVKTMVTEHLLIRAEDSSVEVGSRRSAFAILVWVIKAFVIRGHPYGFELLDNVIEKCGSLDLGSDAASSFIILLHQDDLILNKQSYATVSILFEQRVFTHCFKKLMHGSESVSIRQPKLQVNYLLALGYLMQNIPHQITTNELPKLMLPIIVALSSHDKELIMTILRVAQNIIPNAQDIIVQHLGSFIHALLRLTRFQTTSVKILAIACLSSLATKGKYSILSPFKPSVVKELSVALDDKKRIVRRNTVDCREKWYAIGK